MERGRYATLTRRSSEPRLFRLFRVEGNQTSLVLVTARHSEQGGRAFGNNSKSAVCHKITNHVALDVKHVLSRSKEFGKMQMKDYSGVRVRLMDPEVRKENAKVGNGIKAGQGPAARGRP